MPTQAPVCDPAAAALLVIGMKTDRGKIKAIILIYSVPVIMNVIGKGIFHWAY